MSDKPDSLDDVTGWTVGTHEGPTEYPSEVVTWIADNPRPTLHVGAPCTFQPPDGHPPVPFIVTENTGDRVRLSPCPLLAAEGVSCGYADTLGDECSMSGIAADCIRK